MESTTFYTLQIFGVHNIVHCPLHCTLSATCVSPPSPPVVSYLARCSDISLISLPLSLKTPQLTVTCIIWRLLLDTVFNGVLALYYQPSCLDNYIKLSVETMIDVRVEPFTFHKYSFKCIIHTLHKK